MRTLFALVLVTFRGMVRSRVFQCLAAVVVASTLILPLIIRGDNTDAGQFRIIVRYTLGFVTFMLSITTLWCSCRAAAMDIEERQIHSIVTKPVRRSRIWLGKWIAITAMNAALLAIAGILAYSLLFRMTRTPNEATAPTADLFAAWYPVAPAVPVDNAPIRPGEQPQYAVPPGRGMDWTFNIGQTARARRPLLVRFTIASMGRPTVEPVSATWLIGPDSAADRQTRTATIFPGKPYVFEVHPSALDDNGQLRIGYVNSQIEPPATVVLNRNSDIAVLVQRGSFAPNLAKALAVTWCKLALLAALGVAAGSLLSMPVAVFASCSIAAIFLMEQFIHRVANASSMFLYRPIQSLSLFDNLIRTEFRLIDRVVAPVRQFDVLVPVSDGIFIPPALVVDAIVLLVVVYAGIIALLGIALFNRRELGSPAE